MAEEVVVEVPVVDVPVTPVLSKAAAAKAFASVASEAEREGKSVQVFENFIRVDN
jgi:hypothetical protein